MSLTSFPILFFGRKGRRKKSYTCARTMRRRSRSTEYKKLAGAFFRFRSVLHRTACWFCFFSYCTLFLFFFFFFFFFFSALVQFSHSFLTFLFSPLSFLPIPCFHFFSSLFSSVFTKLQVCEGRHEGVPLNLFSLKRYFFFYMCLGVPRGKRGEGLKTKHQA
jgi:hypothetical protein